MVGSKVYREIVMQLSEMITAGGLKPGDKIPSERELTERLNVGRSSVREALRAIELLGLIEKGLERIDEEKTLSAYRELRKLSTFN